MDKKAWAIAAVTIVLVAVLGVGCWWLMTGGADGYYYVQIDNSKTEPLESKGGIIDPTGGMSLSYTLPGYDKDGIQKEISFGTERELREGAYLRLTVLPIRGVVEWVEVQPDDMPAKAREHLIPPE